MAAQGLDAGLRGREGFCCKTHMLVYGQGSGDFWGVSHNLALLCKAGSICTFIKVHLLMCLARHLQENFPTITATISNTSSCNLNPCQHYILSVFALLYPELD